MSNLHYPSSLAGQQRLEGFVHGNGIVSAGFYLQCRSRTATARAFPPPRVCSSGTNGSSHCPALECSKDDISCVINLIWTTQPPLSSLVSSVCFLKISLSISFLPVTTTIWNSFLYLVLLSGDISQHWRVQNLSAQNIFASPV